MGATVQQQVVQAGRTAWENRAVKGAMRKATGLRLVGGEFEAEVVADLLTCDADRFVTHVAAQYGDWEDFAAWMDVRRMTGEAFAGAAFTGDG